MGYTVDHREDSIQTYNHSFGITVSLSLSKTH